LFYFLKTETAINISVIKFAITGNPVSREVTAENISNRMSDLAPFAYFSVIQWEHGSY